MSSGATDFNTDGIGSAAYDELGFPFSQSIDMEEGDLCYWDAATSQMKPVSSFTYVTSALITRKLIKAVFLGISGGLQKNNAPTVNGARMMARTGIGNFNVVSSTFQPGDLLGINFTSTVADKQKLIKVQDPAEAVAQVVGYYGTATTTVRARLIPGLVGDFTGKNDIETMQFTTRVFAGAAVGVTSVFLADTTQSIFGSGIQLLAFNGYLQTLLTTRNLVVNILNGVTALTNTLTIATTDVCGDVIETDQSADANCNFGSQTLFTVASTAQEPATGQATFVFKFRRKG